MLIGYSIILYSNSFLHYVSNEDKNFNKKYTYYLDKRFLSKLDLNLIKTAFAVANRYSIIPTVTVTDLDKYYYKVESGETYINTRNLFNFFLKNKVIVSYDKFVEIIERG